MTSDSTAAVSTVRLAAPSSEPMFFVVSIRKLVVMHSCTFGLYWLYWFYQNWSIYRKRSGEKVLPFVRTYFWPFFLYSLLSRVDQHLHRSEHNHAWSPIWLTFTSLFLVLLVGGASAMSGAIPEMDLVALALEFSGLWVLARMQRAINVSAGDPRGERNSRFTIWNWIWMSAGILLWVVSGFMFVVWIVESLLGMPLEI